MKKESRREHNPIQGSSDNASQKALQLAPPEEQTTKNLRTSSNDEGVISVDTGNLNFPPDFTEREEKKFQILGLEPVALVILIFALAFIVLVTYFISIEPPKNQGEPAPAGETQYQRPSRETDVSHHALSV